MLACTVVVTGFQNCGSGFNGAALSPSETLDQASIGKSSSMQVMSVPSLATPCANENEFCEFTGIGKIRYGAEGKYTYKLFINGADCRNEIFGDPNEGVFKACHIIELDPLNSFSSVFSLRSSTVIIRNAATSQCIDVEGASREPGARVQQYPCNNTDAQKFLLWNTGRGDYHLINLASGWCLDVPGNSKNPGVGLQQYPCNHSNAQKFNLSYSGVRNFFNITNSSTNLAVSPPDGNNDIGAQLVQNAQSKREGRQLYSLEYVMDAAQPYGYFNGLWRE